MSLDEITVEETAKIAGILETKWNRLVTDHNKLKQELEAANLKSEMLQKDTEFWHQRALRAEARADQHWAEADFMAQEWERMLAQAMEVRSRIKSGILEVAALPAPGGSTPSVVYEQN